MKILVTGGAGFVGSNLVRMLLGDRLPGLEGASVTVLDALTYAGNLANLAPVADEARLEVVHGDIRDTALLDRVVPGSDAIVHLAAESHVDRSARDASLFVETNVVGTQRLLDAALRHGVDRFVQVSTDEVYGSAAGSSSGQRALDPGSPYSASRAGSDLLAHSYHRAHGLDVRIIRSSSAYGPFHSPETPLPLLITDLLEGLPATPHGDGAHVRDWLHVDDHCRGIALALTSGGPGEVYDLGSGTRLTDRELAERLLDAADADAPSAEALADRRQQEAGAGIDRSASAAALGFVPQVPFADGLAETVRWYREHRSWWEPLKERAAL